MDDKQKQFVDALLDASLRHYAEGEARLGFEERVMAGVRSRRRSARWHAAWPLAIAAAALAFAVVVIYRPRVRPAALPSTAKASPTISGPAVAKVLPSFAPPTVSRLRRSHRQTTVDTRPQQFPTPRPLSEQEKLLVAYAQMLSGSAPAPKPQVEENTEQHLTIKPLSIAALKIEPLSPDEERGSK